MNQVAQIMGIIVILALFTYCDISCAIIEKQEISIQQYASPEEIKVIGDHYFFLGSSNITNACNNQNNCEPIGIPIVYRIILLGDLAEGRASNTSYDVYITDILPFESNLINIEQLSITDLNSACYFPIRLFSGEKEPPYYQLSGDLLHISLGDIKAVEFPKEIRIVVTVPCNISPTDLYNIALIKSQNDIECSNNYAAAMNYLGIAYDRRYGLKESELLLNS